MVLFFNDSDILVEAEDRAGQQKRLRHIIEQTCSHVADLDHLISHQRDTAHNEQHRTGVLRDFEALLVFHGLDVSHQCAAASCSEKQGDEITDRLKDLSNCFVHNLTCFKW